MDNDEKTPGMVVDCVISYGKQLGDGPVAVTEKDPYPGAEAWDVYRLTVPEELQPALKDGRVTVSTDGRETYLFDVLRMRKGRPYVVWTGEDGTEKAVALIETLRPPQKPFSKMIWEI